MIILRVKKSQFLKDFFKTDVIKLLEKILKNKLINHSVLNTYLIQNYNSDIKKIVNLFIYNLHFSETKNEYLITLNDIKVNKVSLISLINLIDYGNLNIKGINLFNSNIKSLKNNLTTYQELFIITKGQLWQ